MMIPGENLLQILQVLTYSDIGDFIEVRVNGKMTFNDFPRKKNAAIKSMQFDANKNVTCIKLHDHTAALKLLQFTKFTESI